MVMSGGMDDRPGVHQRAGERVAAVLDHAGKGRAEITASACSLRLSGKHAGRQALGAHGDRRLETARACG